MELEAIIIALAIIVVILGYTTINLLIKNEIAEDVIISQEEFISKLGQIVGDSEKRLEEIDSKEIFKSDDEIGWVFNEIKSIHSSISQFIFYDKEKKPKK